jgi:hypothetical protein
VAPGFDAGDEVNKYRIAYAQQMGMMNSGREVTERAEALFSRYKSAWSKVVDKMRDIKGYPVRTSFTMGFGGPQCQGQGGANTQTADSSASQTPGGLAGQIAGSLFKRKKKQQEETAAPATPVPAALNGMIMPLKVTSELLSVSKDSLGAGAFDPPAGYKKIAEKG